LVSRYAAARRAGRLLVALGVPGPSAGQGSGSSRSHRRCSPAVPGPEIKQEAEEELDVAETESLRELRDAATGIRS
jgi:hypothetical protein